MKGQETVRRRKPITDTQLLLTITICMLCFFILLQSVVLMRKNKRKK